MFGFRSKNRHHGSHGSMRSQNVIFLTDLSEGMSATVSAFTGGRNSREKMSSMGIFQGTDITVVKAEGDEGMMLVSVGSVRIMLDMAMASKILVEKAG
ncbi:hypothetical protein CSA37_01195 [Candidatus Fermentibacteria bacterium]|nr:MAG: hypothetical protein CSA37_13445 [Candidatus Fermentibacteria bacterium]PIE51903.1 MAG: hypothetical protein CSA37_08980 [Candidatus Fermentibacteria bacterium]PIE53465.1 MAG: hypothetical protein CSA37_01195 [Candidatus Fermentibacteria bacterium]